MHKGLFIVAEGGEGSGKTTILGRILRRLEAMLGPDKVISTREPGGTPAGMEIRKTLFNGDHGLSALAELFLFCADRTIHCDSVINPAIKEGKIVLCDRFDGSTVAYQIYARDHCDLEETFRQINSIAKGATSPDLVIFFDVDVCSGLKRALGDKREEVSKFDYAAAEFHKKVQKGYLAQLAENDNWKRVDANKPLEEVEEDVWQLIVRLLPKTTG